MTTRYLKNECFEKLVLTGNLAIESQCHQRKALLIPSIYIIDSNDFLWRCICKFKNVSWYDIVEDVDGPFQKLKVCATKMPSQKTSQVINYSFQMVPAGLRTLFTVHPLCWFWHFATAKSMQGK